MFVDFRHLQSAHPDELITLQELMFRWPYYPIYKICYELYIGRFTNMVISEYIRIKLENENEEDKVYFHSMDWHCGQNSSCGYFNRLAVFKKEVEEAERDNPLYTAESKITSHLDWYDRCTQKTYRKIAPLLLYVNFVLVSYPITKLRYLFNIHIRKFIEADDIYSPSNCLPPPKKDWIIPAESSQPILRTTSLHPPESVPIDHDFLDRLIAEQRDRGIIDYEDLCRMLMHHAPNITGASVSRHLRGIIPHNKSQEDAAKKWGNRLKSATRKRFER